MEILENQLKSLKAIGFNVSLPLGDRFDSTLVEISYGDSFISQDYVSFEKELNIRKYEELMFLIKICETEFSSFKMADGPTQLPFFIRKDEVFINTKFDFRGRRFLFKSYDHSVKEFISKLVQNNDYFNFYVKKVKPKFINFRNVPEFSFPLCVSRVKCRGKDYNVIVLYENSTRVFEHKSSYYFVDDFGEFCDSPDLIFDKLSLIEDIVWRD